MDLIPYFLYLISEKNSPSYFPFNERKAFPLGVEKKQLILG